MALNKRSFAVTAFLSIILLSTPATMNGAFAQSQNKVPDWVKSNAGWWADGSIDEASFVQSIKFLIKENIVIIPETIVSSSSGTGELPDWVKSNAGWWADGSIDEASFVQGIQFLIKEGVMDVSSNNQDNVPEKNNVDEKNPQTDNSENKKQTNKDKKHVVIDLDKDKLKSKFEKIKAKHDKLIQKANLDGKIKVIVELNDDYSKSNLTPQEKIDRKQNIKNKQDSFKKTLSENGIFTHKNLKNNPFVIMDVTPAVLDELISSGMVKEINENELIPISLSSSVPQTGAANVHISSKTGADTVIAILDTGVQSNHNFFMDSEFNSRVISEDCFTGASNPADGTCPNTLDIDTGVGSAAPCDLSHSGCKHGTHVAGIAAGNDPNSGKIGIAPDTKIVAIQVFTSFSPNAPGAYVSDILLGLQRVLELKNGGMNIVAVNLSLGTDGGFSSVCDTASNTVTTAVTLLHDAGVAVIASSGNAGFPNGLSWPACIGKVISVGSVENSNVIPKYIPDYSNTAFYLDLLAPGGNAVCAPIDNTNGCFNDNGSDFGVDSSVADSTFTNTFDSLTGTSMAAPHVAGAWALLKGSDAHPNATPDEILFALKATGIPTLESLSGITTSSIKIDVALDVFDKAVICGQTISDFNSIVLGTSGDDKIHGTSGNDLIVGLGGSDAISGNEGNDCLWGGTGDDNLSGGIGNDYLNGEDNDDHLQGDNGADTIFGGFGIDTISGGNDVAIDILDGGPGNDSLKGGPGNDIINGGDNTDILSGDDGDDILDGGPGDNDVMLGRSGDDTMLGGIGIGDICVGESGTDTADMECEIIG